MNYQQVRDKMGRLRGNGGGWGNESAYKQATANFEQVTGQPYPGGTLPIKLKPHQRQGGALSTFKSGSNNAGTNKKIPNYMKKF